MKTLILKQNTPEIRQAIVEAGITCCLCCEFAGAEWLDYNHSITDKVHGIGYIDEFSITTEESINRFLAECEDPYFCKDVDEFINKIKQQHENNRTASKRNN